VGQEYPGGDLHVRKLKKEDMGNTHKQEPEDSFNPPPPQHTTSVSPAPSSRTHALHALRIQGQEVRYGYTSKLLSRTKQGKELKER
jgi:hypothetical protein